MICTLKGFQHEEFGKLAFILQAKEDIPLFSSKVLIVI